MSPSRRVYAETLALERLDRGTLSLLAERGLGLVAAVRPWDAAAVAPLATLCGELGVELFVWPMVADTDGRWLSACNMHVFERFVDDLRARLRGTPFAGFLLDLEVPFDEVQRWKDAPLSRLLVSIRRYHQSVHGVAKDTLEKWLRDLGRDYALHAAVPPMVVFDHGRYAGWRDVLGLPALDGFACVSPMAYTTLFVGYSRGLFDRPRARLLLGEVGREVARHFGPRASLSLGCVGTGALGDEATYRGPDELREDVATCLVSGVSTLTLFDLGGVLRRERPAAWLDAFAETPSAAQLRDATPARARPSRDRAVVEAATLGVRLVARTGRWVVL